MLVHQGAGDGEPQPHAAGFGVAGLVEAHERLEYILQPGRIDAGPLIADPDHQLAVGALQRHLGAAGVLDGVADEVLQHPAQGVGAAGIDLLALCQTGNRLTCVGIVVAQALQQADQVQLPGRLLLPLLPSEAEGGRQHLFHLLQGLLDPLLVLPLVQKFGAQPQAGDGGTQIVGDGRQHAGSVLHEAIEPGVHAVEGLDGFAHLGRPLFPQRLYVLAAAEPVRVGGQLLERPGGTTEQPDHHADHQARHQHQVEGGLPGPAGRLLVHQRAELQPAAARQLDGAIQPHVLRWRHPLAVLHHPVVVLPGPAALGILLELGADLHHQGRGVTQPGAHQLLEAGAAVVRLQRLVGDAQQQGLAAARLEDLVIEGGGREGQQPHHRDDALHGVAAVDVAERLLPIGAIDLDAEQLDQHQPGQRHQDDLAGQPLRPQLRPAAS